VIDLEEQRKRGEYDPVLGAMDDELLPPERELEAPEQEHEEQPEDKHVEVPPGELARMAGIEPIAPTAEAKAPEAAAPAAAPADKAPEAAGPAGPAAPAAEAVDAKDVPAVAQDLGDAEKTLASRAPETEHAEDKEHEGEEQIAGGEFGPQMAADAEKEKEKEPEPAKAPVDGKAALAGAAAAASGVAEAAHAEEAAAPAAKPAEAKAPEAKPAAAPAQAPAAAHEAAHDAAQSADGFAGMGQVGGKQKWNENAYYKHDKTYGFDVGGTRSVALGKNADAADAAVYATAAVETSGTYDAIQTYDKGILSFGIMQWTLHQGSLMKFLEYLKTKCGEDGAAAFHEHFDALGLDVHGDSMVVGGVTIKPDDAGRKAMDKLIRSDKDTTRRWVVAFHEAGKDERVARAQWSYTKKQYTETAGKSLEKYVGFARKKGYSAKYVGNYHTPSFWCRDPEAAALFFSMTTNNPGYSYYGVIKAADAFMDGAGTDPKKWPDNWTKQFLSIYAAMLPTLIGSWKERVAKTVQHLHLAQEGKGPQAAPAPAASHDHKAARPKAPAEAPKPAPAPAEIKQAAQAPQPAPEEHHGLRWLADVLTRKVVRGLEDATTAAKHFLGISQTGTPAPAPAQEAKAPAPSPKTQELAKKIESAAPKNKPAGKSKGKPSIGADKLTRGKATKTDDQYAFKQKVYETAVGEKASKKPAFGGLAEEEIGDLEGKPFRKDLLSQAQSFLAAARSALHAAQQAGDHEAQKVKSIGVSSGYRAPDKDFKLWDDYYEKYYNETKKAREATGDPHGDAAVKILVRYIAPRKAPPGFSNHSGGTAMDLFATMTNGEVLTATFDNQEGWHKSWIWKWLTQNAPSHGFHPYVKEAWHWEWKE
jgi:LAS superfamily LD-carboxypeptidase LdcB